MKSAAHLVLIQKEKKSLGNFHANILLRPAQYYADRCNFRSGENGRARNLCRYQIDSAQPINYRPTIGAQ